MSDPRNDHGTTQTSDGIVSELLDKIVTAKAMLKAIDAYWELHPDAPYNEDGDCPVCQKPNKHDWEHENCFEEAWDRFEKLRKEFEEK